MLITDTQVAGAYTIDIEPHEDARGFFARTFCEREFAAAGLSFRSVQANISSTRQRGTVRGMHFQWPPSREAKLVRCTRGHIFDVIIDLRPDSPSYMQHLWLELQATGYGALYVPPGVAHGFQTLQDDTEVLYHMGDYYDPSLAAGVRWDDPAFAIRWPLPAVMMSERDRTYPYFDPRALAPKLAGLSQAWTSA